jgi:hypothetical protein
MPGRAARRDRRDSSRRERQAAASGVGEFPCSPCEYITARLLPLRLLPPGLASCSRSPAAGLTAGAPAGRALDDRKESPHALWRLSAAKLLDDRKESPHALWRLSAAKLLAELCRVGPIEACPDGAGDVVARDAPIGGESTDDV